MLTDEEAVRTIIEDAFTNKLIEIGVDEMLDVSQIRAISHDACNTIMQTLKDSFYTIHAGGGVG